jgi:drug/metabolite transporter (DMT)-like permease
MKRQNLAAVVLWMAGALLSFSATAVSVRALSRTLGTFEILALRNAAGVAILLSAALVNPALRADMRPHALGMHVLRNGVHFAATYAWTLGVVLLPLATVFALEFTAPAWVGLFAVLLLRERMTAPRFVAIALGFAGVLVILRPGLGTLEPASFIVLGAALGFALTAIATKKLTATDTTAAILLAMNVIPLPLNVLGLREGFWPRLAEADALPLAGICLGGLLSHLCLTNAYRHGDAILVVPLDFLRIPLIAVVAWSLYGEPLDPFVLAGSVVIISGILWSLRAEARPARTRALPSDDAGTGARS